MHAQAKQAKVTLLSRAAGRVQVTIFPRSEGRRSDLIVSGQRGIALISFLEDLEVITPALRIQPSAAGRFYFTGRVRGPGSCRSR